MARRRLEKTNFLPYHVTARANNRENFPVSLDELWRIIGERALFLSLIYEVEIQAFVLMPNHFHMLLTVPEHDLGIVMNEFMKSVSRTVHLISGRSGHLFGGSYYWSMIKDTVYFAHALKYVYRNPVKAGLCDRVEDYPFSTLSGLLGRAHLPFPIYFTRIGMELSLPMLEPVDQLSWLNNRFPEEVEARIKLGLRKRIFSRVIDRKTRRLAELLESLV
jgi:REP element-mobilizing transposase RayT